SEQFFGLKVLKQQFQSGQEIQRLGQAKGWHYAAQTASLIAFGEPNRVSGRVLCEAPRRSTRRLTAFGSPSYFARSSRCNVRRASRVSRAVASPPANACRVC